ncbi:MULTISPECIES: hypothetical protein [Nitrosopumilus]|uniref:Uncharacterized protein n=1 Tax=Nitrosopumilus piranensis TaxID=1582439 RepID=A0A0C5BXC4_9ARCH|nr:MULTISPECIES: hypothetical protein [Nitrosopumilus]AJM92924.1 hypothetical protein NPIRD3C_1712 [Nitrosopumilus piranensis]KAF6244137.1 hypothetical protein C6989_09870 [Nitrosopumilus sp. b2]
MSSDEISSMFDIETQKLQNLISNVSENMEISQIVEVYYQVMNVSSMISMLKQQLDSQNPNALLEQIGKTEKLISEKFNTDIHPKILQTLSNSIQETTKSLQSNSGEKTKEQIKNESKLFEELRKKMSTKEFVEQYDKGLT